MAISISDEKEKAEVNESTCRLEKEVSGLGIQTVVGYSMRAVNGGQYGAVRVPRGAAACIVRARHGNARAGLHHITACA